MDMSPLAVKGCMLGVQAFEHGGIFIVPHLLLYGASVFQPHPENQSPLKKRSGMLRIYPNLDPHGFPFICLMRHARRCWEPILTKILTCPHQSPLATRKGVLRTYFNPDYYGSQSVASFNTEGDTEDLL
jgi:hypothetical protein